MRWMALSVVVVLFHASTAPAYVEVAYTLGRVIKESRNVVLVEVAKVDKNRNLIIYKKLKDLKGKHPQNEIKHNIGKGGFHPREWQNIMRWAAPGKKAVFFHNGGASVTCMGSYWYQCYPRGQWWSMSHAEPYMLRTYCGKVESLASAVSAIGQGREVVVPCMADGNKKLLHERKGKMQLVKASMKRINYNSKRDFVAFGGGEGIDIPEFKTITILAAGSANWKFIPSASVKAAGNRWQLPDFDDSNWRTGKTPIGYGEAEINKRKGTTVKEQGQPFYFRRTVDVPQTMLRQKGTQIRLKVASDNSANVYLNGKSVAQDNADHEFAYWNADVSIPQNQLRPGKNVIAVKVNNASGSSDIYLDMEISALVELPKKTTTVVKGPKVDLSKLLPKLLAKEQLPKTLVVDKSRRMVIVPAAVAPRKLPNLDKTYPLEVIATYPKGQKAHETVITFNGVKPIHVHKAMLELGLKPGKPAKGEGAKAQGPLVNILVEFNSGGKTQRVPIEKLLVNTRNNKPVPPLQWHFTGSILQQPDPTKDDYAYGADLTGTLISIFPVTEETVFQSQLTLKEEAALKLEVAKGALPKAGTALKLIIQAK